MGDGSIQPEFTDTLQALGRWMARYGESIYGTRGNVLPPQEWGGVTVKNNTFYVHILKKPGDDYLFIPGFKEKVIAAKWFDGKGTVKFRQQPEGLFLYTGNLVQHDLDSIVEVSIAK
jgi:alpha-L-fucosidase